MKEELRKKMDEYIAGGGCDLMRTAVKTTVDMLKSDFEGTVENMIKTLGKWGGEAVILNDAVSYEIGELVWKEFDYGTQAGIAGRITSTEFKKALGRFVYKLIHDGRRAEEEKRRLQEEVDNRTSMFYQTIYLFRKHILGEVKLKECSTCGATGKLKWDYYYDEDLEPKEGTCFRCWTCHGLGYVSDMVVVDGLAEEVDEE